MDAPQASRDRRGVRKKYRFLLLAAYLLPLLGCLAMILESRRDDPGYAVGLILWSAPWSLIDIYLLPEPTNFNVYTLWPVTSLALAGLGNAAIFYEIGSRIDRRRARRHAATD
jgi:hypothetical protein